MKFLLLLIVSCATIYQRGPDSTLVIRPRAGHADKLTNQVCTKKDWLGRCKSFDIKEFDFNSDSVRKELRDLKFVCNVAGERFAVCEKSRGLCRLTRVDQGWFKPKITVVKKYYSMHDDYDFLIQSNAYCCAFDSVCGRHMFGPK